MTPTEKKKLLKSVYKGNESAILDLIAYEEKRERYYVAGLIKDRYEMEFGTVVPNRLEIIGKRIIKYIYSACPKCFSENTSVKNHNLIWHDGDITCDECGTFVRYFDAG